MLLALAVASVALVACDSDDGQVDPAAESPTSGAPTTASVTRSGEMTMGAQRSVPLDEVPAGIEAAAEPFGDRPAAVVTDAGGIAAWWVDEDELAPIGRWEAPSSDDRVAAVASSDGRVFGMSAHHLRILEFHVRDGAVTATGQVGFDLPLDSLSGVMPGSLLVRGTTAVVALDVRSTAAVAIVDLTTGRSDYLELGSSGNELADLCAFERDGRTLVAALPIDTLHLIDIHRAALVDEADLGWIGGGMGCDDERIVAASWLEPPSWGSFRVTASGLEDGTSGSWDGPAASTVASTAAGTYVVGQDKRLSTCALEPTPECVEITVFDEASDLRSADGSTALDRLLLVDYAGTVHLVVDGSVVDAAATGGPYPSSGVLVEST